MSTVTDVFLFLDKRGLRKKQRNKREEGGGRRRKND